MNKFYKRFVVLIVLVLLISGGVIYFTVDMNTLSNLTAFKAWSVILAVLFVIIGLILGPLAEQQMRRALAISQGDASVFITHPLAASLLALAVLSLLAPVVLRRWRKRHET